MASSTQAKRVKVLSARFNPKERIAFYNDATKLLKIGIRPGDMLVDVIENARQSKSRKRRRLADVYSFILSGMSDGRPFSEAIARVVPPEEAMIILSGERSKALENALATLSTLIIRRQEASKQLIGAIMGAIGYFLAASTFITFVAFRIAPVMAKAATPAVIAQMHIAPYYFGFCIGYVHYIGFILAPLIGAAILMIRSLPKWTGDKRRWCDEHIPPWNLYHRMQATMFLTTASIMISSGSRMKDVMVETSRLGSAWFKWQARRVMRLLEGGRSEVDSLGSGILPVDAMERLRIYRRLPDFTAVMRELSDDNFNMYMKNLDLVGKVTGRIGKIFFVLVILFLSLSIMDFMLAIQSTAKY